MIVVVVGWQNVKFEKIQQDTNHAWFATIPEPMLTMRKE